ncbi:MAG: hypothetical protein Q4D04_02870 [Clostridia bacterium]|nr:hypothetical protein [Clostridia bacterium]
MKKRLFYLLIVIIITLSLAPQLAHARVSDIIKSYNVVVEALSDGRIKAKASVRANEITTMLGFTTILIQEYNGTKWVTVKNVNDKYGSGESYSYTTYYNGTTGKKYRGRVSCKGVYDGVTDTRPLKSSPSSVIGK